MIAGVIPRPLEKRAGQGLAHQKMNLNSAITTIKPIRKMMPTVPPRNFNMVKLLFNRT
jgi:hypothetical protein